MHNEFRSATTELDTCGRQIPAGHEQSIEKRDKDLKQPQEKRDIT